MKLVNMFCKASFWSLVALTVVMSLLPGEKIPSTLVFWDKAQHALGFAALAVFGLLAYPRALRRMVPGLLVLGLVIECAQAMTGWRQGDWMDWLADALGVVLGSAAMVATMRWRGRPLFSEETQP